MDRLLTDRQVSILAAGLSARRDNLHTTAAFEIELGNDDAASAALAEVVEVDNLTGLIADRAIVLGNDAAARAATAEVVEVDNLTA